ncbi:hypothetical protein AB0J52_09515 [Spirillospora sp. NPDC049652]
MRALRSPVAVNLYAVAPALAACLGVLLLLIRDRRKKDAAALWRPSQRRWPSAHNSQTAHHGVGHGMRPGGREAVAGRRAPG